MRNRDLKQCIAIFNAMCSDNNLKPEQRDQIELIISELKKLARKGTLKKAEVFSCVNTITRRLLKVLDRQ